MSKFEKVTEDLLNNLWQLKKPYNITDRFCKKRLTDETGKSKRRGNGWSQQNGKPKKYFIAINLYNNEDVLPDYIRELMRLVKYLTTTPSTSTSTSTTHDPSTIFISIYENGSTDTYTKPALRMLDLALGAMGVPRRIVTAGVRRDEGEHRIKRLARV
ncbi:capsular associated protein, partial [Quaeritorhiza haematococci]